MALRLYLLLSGAIFLMVALMHLGRLVNGWSFVLGPFAIPLEVSYAGFPVAAGYCAWAVWLLIAQRRAKAP